MTEQEFKQLARQGFNRIPVASKPFGDSTPRFLFISMLPTSPIPICWNRCRAASVFGRYSFIGLPRGRPASSAGHTCAEYPRGYW